MSVLCSGDCHVWLGSSSLCTCEAHRVAMYGLPQNYNPFGPHVGQPANPLPDVPASRLEAARLAGASWLSADGLRAYDQRKYTAWVCYWNEQDGQFGSWYRVVSDELPNDAVRME